MENSSVSTVLALLSWDLTRWHDIDTQTRHHTPDGGQRTVHYVASGR